MGKNEMAEEALKALNELEEETSLENLVKDNKIEFLEGDKLLRVRKLTFQDQKELNSKKRTKYLSFVQDDSYLFRNDWIKIYKNKNIDIQDMRKQIAQTSNNVKAHLLRLAKAKDVKSIDTLKTEINSLREKQYELSNQVTDYLSFSIEDSLYSFSNSYTVYLVLEVKEGDNWVKYFKSYEDFEGSEEIELISKACYYVNHLMYADILEIKE